MHKLVHQYILIYIKVGQANMYPSFKANSVMLIQHLTTNNNVATVEPTYQEQDMFIVGLITLPTIMNTLSAIASFIEKMEHNKAI